MGRFHGLEIALRRFGGARAVRVVHPSRQIIEAHRHDWACLTLHVLGHGREAYDGGEICLDGPSAVLHPVGALHSDVVERVGLETVSIQFDPSWLKGPTLSLTAGPTRSWRGGRVGAAARRLAAAWTRADLPESVLARGTGQFVNFALISSDNPAPAWLRRSTAQTHWLASLSTRDLARRLDLHPAWLARSYRAAVGEGLHETARRRRVEAAVALLRDSDIRLVEVALAVGFCDQSHMNRSFRAVLGRTPLQVRAEQKVLAQLFPA